MIPLRSHEIAERAQDCIRKLLPGGQQGRCAWSQAHSLPLEFLQGLAARCRLGQRLFGLAPLRAQQRLSLAGFGHTMTRMIGLAGGSPRLMVSEGSLFDRVVPAPLGNLELGLESLAMRGGLGQAIPERRQLTF